jgi:DnaJ-class molecular chaperone
VTHPVELTLEEAFHGTSRRLQLSTDQPCGRCHGTGVVAGQGRKSGKRPETMTMVTCPDCGGRGVVSGRKSLDVKIPRGVTEGSKVRLAGMGGQAGPGGRPGDLHLEVHLRPHRWFQVDGHDLICELPVRDDEAVLGATVQVPTLEGRVGLKIPPGSQQGSRLRLKEKGLPRLGEGGRGDLYYTLKIVTPAAPSEEERAVIQQLRELRERQGDRADPRRALFS